MHNNSNNNNNINNTVVVDKVTNKGYFIDVIPGDVHVKTQDKAY